MQISTSYTLLYRCSTSNLAAVASTNAVHLDRMRLSFVHGQVFLTQQGNGGEEMREVEKERGARMEGCWAKKAISIRF